MDQRKSEVFLRRAMGIPILALAVFVTLLLAEIQSLRTSLGRLDHTDQVISVDRELMKLTIDMETGVRGYLNTGRDEFLQPYTDAAQIIDARFAELIKLISDEPSQQVQLGAMQSSFDKWRFLAERAVELHRNGKENRDDQPTVDADSLEMKRLMDSIRAQHEIFAATETNLRGKFAQRASGESKLTTFTCTILFLAGGSLLALFIRRQMQFLGKDFKASVEIAEADAASMREKAQLLDLAYDTIMVRALDGTIRFWNQGAEATYGYPKEQAAGQISQTLLHTVFPEALAGIHEKLLRNGSWEGELTRTIQAGTRVQVATRWLPQLDKNGQLCGVMEIGSDITARKQREEELVERDLLLRTIAEQTDIGLVVLSEDRRYIYCNPAHAQAFGRDSTEIVGERLAGVIGGLYKQVSPQLDAAFAGDQVDFQLNVPARPSKENRGHNRQFAVTCKLLKRSGESSRVIAVLVDITGRKRAEEAIRSSEERLSGIVRMAMDGVITLDSSQRIVLFNPAAEKIFGCHAEEAIGEPLGHFIPPQSLEVADEHGQDSTRNGTISWPARSPEMFHALHTNYGLRADGNKFPLEATISQVSLTGERLYTVILRDITQRKHAEEELREQEERFRSMYVHAAVGFSQMTMDGAYTMVNPALCDLLGYTEIELLNRNSEDITHPEDRGRESTLIDSMLSGRRDFFEVEKRYVHRSGATVWVNVTSSVVRDIAKRPLYRISVVQDTTRRRRAEDQLLQAQKMEAIGRLAGGVAHDFNNLLTVILGNAELALARLPQIDPNRARLQQIQSSGQIASSLTKQLLAFSRQQPIDKQVVDLKEIVESTEFMLRRLLPENIEMVVRCPQETCPVKADPSQLRQVLINLVVNAADAMPHGGALTIDVRTTELADAASQGASTLSGPWELLTVSDTGSGMDAETIAHIFEPFFTTKPVGKGTGLGLATLHGIVHQCDGRIAVSSELGAGSIFKVYLPRSLDGAETKTDADKSLQISGGAETILLVDDSAPLRELMRQIFSVEGYSVLEASDGVQALKLSRNYPGIIHLLITDIVMPRMDGTALAEHLVQERPNIALIFVTGYNASKCAMPHHPPERYAIIEKPYRPDALLQTARRMLDEVKSLPVTRV